MPDYSNITLKELFDTVILRAGNQRNNENIGWSSTVQLINRAIRETVISVLPYKDYAFIEQVSVANGTILPWRYIKSIRMLLSASGDPPYWEARYANPKEYFSVSNWKLKHSWNQSVINNPIYTIWGSGASLIEHSQVTVYITPNTAYQTGTAPSGYNYYTDDFAGILEFYSTPPDISLETDEVPIPYEFIELVVLSTLIRLYARTGQKELLQIKQKQIVEERNNVLRLFRERNNMENRNLIGYREPVQQVEEKEKEDKK